MKVDSRFITVLIFCFWLSRGIWGCDVTADDRETLEPIDISGFQSSISHWRKLKDDSRFIQAIDGQASYKPDQVQEIVANILLFQPGAQATVN